jgi:hypothetical protein
MKKTCTAAILGTVMLFGACERTPVQPAEMQLDANYARAAEPAGGTTTAAMNRQIAAMRQATARYHDIAVARADGYVAISPCVAAPGVGGMGIHYANPRLMQDAGMNPTEPEMLLYLPQPDGSMQLIGIEYAIVVPAWHAAGHQERPSFLGHTFDILPGDAAEGRPDLYTLHAWIWQPNPAGMFAPFNPRISCPPGDDAGHHAAH